MLQEVHRRAQAADRVLGVRVGRDERAVEVDGPTSRVSRSEVRHPRVDIADARLDAFGADQRMQFGRSQDVET